MDVLILAGDDGKPATYCVQHYAAEATGIAFGPLGLDQTLQFCFRLSSILAKRSCDQPPLTLTSPPEDTKAHTNACVLVGAYLVLVEQWSAMQVAEVVGYREAELKFPCSWAQQGCSEDLWLMPVSYCWEGLQTASQLGWIDRKWWKDEACLAAFRLQYRHLSTAYDASWIVPGKLMISADPITTAFDPNPATFTDVWFSANDSEPSTPSKSPTKSQATPRAGNMLDLPETQNSRSDGWVRLSSPSEVDMDLYIEGKIDLDCTPCEAQISSDKVDLDAKCHIDTISDEDTADDASDAASLSEPWGMSQSVATVSKSYKYNGAPKFVSTGSTKSFVANMKECGVNSIIRCNYSNEPGMPAVSYNGKKWEAFGITHKDLRFADVRGGLPQRSIVAKMLKTTDVTSDSLGACLIHCKGGFGRSTTLGCCWAMCEYDIPGQALLGWVRIARPGSITCSEQEDFLISLKGRADVELFAGVKGDLAKIRAARDASGAGANPACCTLQ
jgi:hypothetical protein